VIDALASAVERAPVDQLLKLAGCRCTATPAGAASPAAGGGIQHVADCFAQYMQRKDSEPRVLIEYADRLGNGAVFKRLGFLAERHPRGDALIDAAKVRLTKGYAKLDPALDCSRLITRWRLRVPNTWITKRRG
jgi:predicted transcriptional regulator of viral defense system